MRSSVPASHVLTTIRLPLCIFCNRQLHVTIFIYLFYLHYFYNGHVDRQWPNTRKLYNILLKMSDMRPFLMRLDRVRSLVRAVPTSNVFKKNKCKYLICKRKLFINE